MLLRFFLVLCLSATLWSQTTTSADNKPPAPASKDAAASAATDALSSARALLKAGKLAEASVAFKALVEKDPSSADAQAGLIRSLLRARKYAEAEEAGKSAIAAAPNSALVHATYGDVNFSVGELSDAEREYRTALARDANSVRGLYGMARLYTMLSMYKHAKDAVAKAHELDPQDESVSRMWLATLPRKERLDAFKKTAPSDSGNEDGASLREEDRLKLLAAESEKKPWVLAKPVEKTEIKMEPYGRTLAAVGITRGNQGGAMTISKGYGLHVKFNDRAGATLLMDTGASGIIIGSKLAEKAGVVKIANSAFGGIGEGFTRSYYGWVDRIKIGDVEFKDCIVEVSTKNDIADEAGLIGTDVFEKFLVTLDFSELKVKLDPLPKNPDSTGDDDQALDRYIAPEMQSFSKFFRVGHLIVVPAVLGTAKRNGTGLFALDTGADTNTISVRLASKITKVSFEEGYIKGVSAKIKEVFSGDQVFLHFAGIHVRSDDILAFDHSSVSSGVGLAGLVGIRALSQTKMTIDYRDGLVKIEPYHAHDL